jgi:predicted ATPase
LFDIVGLGGIEQLVECWHVIGHGRHDGGIVFAGADKFPHSGVDLFGDPTLLGGQSHAEPRPGGGRSYAETDDEREETALSAAVEVRFRGPRPPQGLFLRADRLADAVAQAGRLPLPTTNERRLADEQSRGEGVLSLLMARVEASETMLYLLDEPETGLSPRRQMALLCLLDSIHGDGRSQALVATHSPILMSHPGADILWLGGDGIERRTLEEIDHWRDMRRFMRDPETSLRRLLSDE